MDRFFKRIKYSPEIFFRTLICSWFFTSAVNLIAYSTSFTNLAFAQDKTWKLIVTGVIMALAFAVLTFFEYRLPDRRTTEYALISSYMLFALLVMTEKGGVMISLPLMIVGVLVALYTLHRGCFDFGSFDISKKTSLIGIGIIAFGFTFVLAAFGVLRYETYASPNFDFGIFCQMFHNMSETLIPNTTCERDYLLSHFAVHFSPICYLLLPIYWIFPYPNTLQIAQALILMSGVVPVILIAKEKGYSNKASGIMAFLYCCFPAISLGCNYDFHENCFLLPLLLWVFYFGEKERYVYLAIFTVLTLLVKEDVFIYVIIYGIFLIVSKKKYRTGTLMCAGALLYFAISYTILTRSGLGIMTDSRFGNMIYGNGGLIGAVKTLVTNPGYALSQIFIDKDGESVNKLTYMVKLLAPLALLPLATKKMSRYILVAPMLLNLLSTWPYQCDLGFQYHFGIVAFLIYAAILNAADLRSGARRYLFVIACVCSFILYIGLVMGTQTYLVKNQMDFKDVYDKMDDVLCEYIPDDASVACTTYLVPHLASRDEIYETYYHKKNGKAKTDVDYAAFIISGSYELQSTREAADYFSAGYKEVYRDDILLILESPNYN